MQDEAASKAELALECVELPRAAVETITRGRWERARFISVGGRTAVPAAAQVRGIGTAALALAVEFAGGGRRYEREIGITLVDVGQKPVA